MTARSSGHLIASAGRREPPKAVQMWIMWTTIVALLYFGGRFGYALVRVLAG